jgi:hypothetical protein
MKHEQKALDGRVELVCSRSVLATHAGADAMKPILIAAFLATALWLPAQAAQPAPSTGPDTITFAQYRDWRVNFIAEQQRRLAARLAETGLGQADRERLTREKAYYDRQAAMPADQRDKMFRGRFNLIDTDHDGTIDQAERTAWHNKQQAYFHQRAARYRRADAAPTAH